MAVNRWMASASAMMGVTVLVHVFVGGPEIHVPVQASTLDPVVRGVSAVLWHGMTALLAICAVALAWLARHRNRPLEWVLIALQVSFAGLFLWVGAAQLGDLWPMPQWIIFLGIPAVMLAARRRQT